MSAISDIPELKRMRFFAGQRLTAQDMTDLQTANREMRWLHNRSLHGWGIGIGYGVTGERGDTSVTVAPGYAVDCLGRELILTDPVTKTVPAVSQTSTFFLTATYMADAAQSTVEERPGVCLPSGTVRLSEGPSIQWQQTSDIQDGINLILAQAVVANCQLDDALALSVRRQARPSQQNFISSGQTDAASTIWTTLIEGGIAVGVTTQVDTSGAGFHAVPTYFAHVMGPRVLPLPGGLTALFALVAIRNPTPSAFTCDVYVINASSGNPPPAGFTAQWSVVWMGVEG